MLFYPAVIDLEIEDNTPIDLECEDGGEMDLEIEQTLIIPVIPKNYCRYDYDGSKLYFS